MQISEPAEYAILGLLESQPMHGYEMFQQFQTGTLPQIVRLEMSQMYAFLKTLEQLSYIEAELEPQGICALKLTPMEATLAVALASKATIT